MLKSALILLPAMLTLAACDQMGPPYGPGPVAGYGQIAPAAYVQYGTIIRVRPVTMQRTANGDQIVGAVAGGLVGAVIGNQFGAGSGKDLMTGAGAITGAMIGSRLAAGTGTYTSQAWTVRLDNGGTMTIIQASNMFRVGERVRIVHQGNNVYLEP